MARAQGFDAVNRSVDRVRRQSTRSALAMRPPGLSAREWRWVPVGFAGVCAVLIGVMVAAAMGTLTALYSADRLTTTRAPAVVTARPWVRELAIERWQRVEGTAPCAAVPVGVPREGVAPGVCRYTVDAWVPAPSRVARGNGDAPRWPEAPAACATPAYGCERVTGRTERTGLVLSFGRDQRRTCEVDAATWAEVEARDPVTVPVGGLTGRPRCSQLRREGVSPAAR